MDKLKEYVQYADIYLTGLEWSQKTLSEQMAAYDEDSKAHRSMDEEYLYLSGQITATQHLLSGANDMLNGELEIRFGE